MKEAAISRGKQAAKTGVDIRLNTPAPPETLDEIQPDAVVIAAGAQPIHPNIPGADMPHALGSFDLLEERVAPRGKAVGTGGGLVGLEAAEFIGDAKKARKMIEAVAEAVQVAMII
jgi:NADPH-dependent 2,4-dienoyl-CoA reductase/sulfur reductase-like enzyme